MDSVFRKAKNLSMSITQWGAAIRLIPRLQSGPTLIWVVISTKELEGIVLRVAVDDAHDLLPCHLLLFTHNLTRWCKTVLEASVFLQ